MIFIESPSTDPYFNLALEEYIFESMDRSKSYFMLWQNENTIVVGKYQNTAEEINQQYVETHGIRVVRRLSGGGAVYHDKGNLNFTFIVDQDRASDFDFKVFVLPVIRALERFGVHAEFNGRNDLTISGHKFSGNSQYAKCGRLMHHGCIMLDSNLEHVVNALKVKNLKFESKSAKSVRSRVTTINSHTSKPVSMEAFKAALKECSMESGGLEPHVLTPTEIAAAEQLRAEKYVTWNWNYGKSPAYTVKKEGKFPAGLITAYLSAEHGVLQSIRLYGDFFGHGNLHDLEAALEGLPLSESLLSQLERLSIDSYINHLSAKNLYDLLMY